MQNIAPNKQSRKERDEKIADLRLSLNPSGRSFLFNFSFLTLSSGSVGAIIWFAVSFSSPLFLLFLILLAPIALFYLYEAVVDIRNFCNVASELRGLLKEQKRENEVEKKLHVSNGQDILNSQVNDNGRKKEEIESNLQSNINSINASQASFIGNTEKNDKINSGLESILNDSILNKINKTDELNNPKLSISELDRSSDIEDGLDDKKNKKKMLQELDVNPDSIAITFKEVAKQSGMGNIGNSPDK